MNWHWQLRYVTFRLAYMPAVHLPLTSTSSVIFHSAFVLAALSYECLEPNWQFFADRSSTPSQLWCFMRIHQLSSLNFGSWQKHTIQVALARPQTLLDECRKTSLEVHLPSFLLCRRFVGPRRGVTVDPGAIPENWRKAEDGRPRFELEGGRVFLHERRGPWTSDALFQRGK